MSPESNSPESPSPTPPEPAPDAQSGHNATPSAPLSRLSPRALLPIAIAFVIGLGLFALVWYGERDEDFYTVEPVANPDTAPEFDPLPRPLPAGRSDGASGLGEEAPVERQAQAGEQPHIVEPPSPPPAPAAPPTPAPPPPVAASGDATQPVPIDNPPPRYPRRALRRGIEGTVLVRVDVGPDGVPTSVGIVRSSRSRELDRAALEAVRRWRFRPARVDGHPTVGSVVVPIDFNLRGR